MEKSTRDARRPEPLVVTLGGESPRIDATAWLAPTATVVGNVTIGAGVGVYYGAVLRAEGASITVGENSNVQDNSVVHAGLDYNVVIGAGVTIGHGAIVHGCDVGDDVLVGMGAIVLNNATVGAGSLIAAGAVVPESAMVPPASLVIGAPGRVVRTLDARETAAIREGALHYQHLIGVHRAGWSR